MLYIKRILFTTLIVIILSGCGSGDSGSSSEPDAQETAFAAIGVGFFLKKNPTVGDVVTETELASIINLFADSGLSRKIRTFGVGAGLQQVGEIANGLGLSVDCGVFLDADLATNDIEIQTAIDEANRGFCETLIVGNETILFGTLTLAQQINYIDTVKAAVPASVKVSYSDTHDSYANNPSLFDAVDVAYINLHPFNHAIPVDNLLAISAVDGWYNQMQGLAGNTPIVVAEIGYPSAGSNGTAVGSVSNSALFMHQTYTWCFQNTITCHYFELADNLFKSKFASGEADFGFYDSDLNQKDPLTVGKILNGELLDLSLLSSIPGGPGDAEILFTSVPAIGSTENLMGQVLHVDPTTHAVAVYIRVPGFGWVNKPFFTLPLTTIAPNGITNTDITTGGNDSSATDIAAFVIQPDIYTPPILAGVTALPNELLANSVASISVVRN